MTLQHLPYGMYRSISPFPFLKFLLGTPSQTSSAVSRSGGLPLCINVLCFIAPKALIYTLLFSVHVPISPVSSSLILTDSFETWFLAFEANLLLIQHSGTILATVCLRPPTRKFSKGTFSTIKLSSSIKYWFQMCMHPLLPLVHGEPVLHP